MKPNIPLTLKNIVLAQFRFKTDFCGSQIPIYEPQISLWVTCDPQIPPVLPLYSIELEIRTLADESHLPELPYATHLPHTILLLFALLSLSGCH